MCLKRKKLIFGIILLLIGIDGIFGPEIIVSHLPPQISEIWQIYPFIKIEQPTKSFPEPIVKLYNWPFLVPLMVGVILIGMDIYYFRVKSF